MSERELINVVCLATDKPGGAENVLKQIVENDIANKYRIIIATKRSTDFWDISDRCKVEYASTTNTYIGLFHTAIKLLSVSRQFKINRIYSSQTYINGLLGLLRGLGLIR